MKIKGILILVITFFFIISNCNSSKDNSIETHSNVIGKTIKISINIKNKENFYNKYNSGPQMAFWLEDKNGNLLETLYVTEKFGKQNWFAGGGGKNETIRKDALPYWLNKYIESGKSSPTPESPLPDTITSATPNDNFTITSKYPDEQVLNILLEINRSYDWNDAYPKSENKDDVAYYNGQPSLIYSAEIDLSVKQTYQMEIIGHSHPKGLDGELYNDLDTFTGASQMIENPVVEVE